MEDSVVKGNNILFSLSAIVVLSIIGVYLDNNIAIVALILLFTFFGTLISYIINTEGDIKNSIYLFLLFFGIYLSYNLLIHVGLINMYGVEYIKSDGEWFYGTSNDVYNRLKSGYTFFEVADIQEYGDTAGAVYLYGLISFFANIYGENTVLVQKIGVLFIASLIPMVMYGISRLYLSEKIAFNVAIIYGLFSFIPFLSSTLLRDLHIALMFILTMYIILQKWSVLRFFILIFISFYSYYLREQTGIFMIGFTSIYFFTFIHTALTNKYTKMFIYLAMVAIVTILILNSGFLMDMFNQISEGSSSRSIASASSGSMGAKIAKLPFGLNVVALLGFGQIQPFPPSLIFEGSHKGVLELSFLIAGIAWFFGWGFLIYGVLKEKILQTLDLKILLMFIFSILYIVLISVIEFSQRRQMAVYPILFLVMVFSYLNMSITARNKVWIAMSLLYITIVLVINYMKL